MLNASCLRTTAPLLYITNELLTSELREVRHRSAGRICEQELAFREQMYRKKCNINSFDNRGCGNGTGRGMRENGSG